MDAIRSVAALAVLLGHLRSIFFVDYELVTDPNPLTIVVYFLTGFGRQSVLVFFVLSGFLIASVILRRRHAGKWSWSEYALDRIVRLETVLIPALVFGAVCDNIGIRLAPNLYDIPPGGLGEVAAAQAMNLSTFLCNAVFLQTVAAPTFGSNGALWSLSNEFWYYMLFPALVALACSRRLRSSVLPAVVVAALAFVLPANMLLQFPIWLAGAALAWLVFRWRVPRAARAGLTITSATALAGSLVLSRARPSSAIDFVAAAAFTAFLCAALSWNRASAGYQRAARVASGFSYTLYAFHSPILRCIRALISPASAWQPSIGRLAIAAAIACAVIAFCFAVSRVTEHRTKIVRTWVRTLIPDGAGRLASRSTY